MGGARPAPAEEPRGPGWSEMLQGERRRGAPGPGSTEPAGGLTAAVRPRAPAPEIAPLHGAEVGRLVVVTAEVVVAAAAAEIAA